MSRLSKNNRLRAFSAAVIFTAGAITGTPLLSAGRASGVGAAELVPALQAGQKGDKTPIGPGEQRARMIKILESIDQRLKSVDQRLEELNRSLDGRGGAG